MAKKIKDDNENHSDVLYFDKNGNLRMRKATKKDIVMEKVDMLQENPRVRPVNIELPDGTIDEGILLPKKFGEKTLAAAGSQILSNLSMQPSTGSGILGLPSVGGVPQKKSAFSHTDILEEMQRRYPQHFMPRPIPASNIREAIDPYGFAVRNQFTNAAREDPTLGPALRKRKNAFFRNGFTLELEVKDKRSLTTNQTMTDDELATFSTQIYTKYHLVLRQLETWMINPHIGLLKNMKRGFYSAVVQGRYLVQFAPALSILEPGALPLFMKALSAEETHNVVIDKFTAQIVACRINSLDNDKFMLLPDEFVYGYINDDTLTKYETLYGRADLEPVIQASRTNKFIISEAYPNAVIAGYMPKVIGQIPVEGRPEQKQKILEERAKAMDDPSINAFLFEASEHTKVESYPQTVNQTMISDIRRDLDEVMLGGVGSTKAQISRTEGLTRDNATIQEIENERNVVTPDEEVHSEFFETQLLNPLFAHLVGVPEEYLDARIVIRRIPDKEDVLKKYNSIGEKGGGAKEGQPAGPEGRQENLVEQKEEDIAAGALHQRDETTALGASGNTVDKLTDLASNPPPQKKDTKPKVPDTGQQTKENKHIKSKTEEQKQQ